MLLEAGADPGHPNKAGYTPGRTARELENEDVAELLEAAIESRKTSTEE